MKTLLTTLALFLIVATQAQTPVIKWQRSLGGIKDEYASTISPTRDGCFIISGTSNSTDGDLAGLPAGNLWVVKISDAGNVRWQTKMGGGIGSRGDIKQTSDGGYILAGQSGFIKLDSLGTLQWSKALSNSSSFYSVKQLKDGNFIAVGGNQDVSGRSIDFWVVKISSSGNLIWNKKLGGTGYDLAKDVIETKDGGYIVCGITNSTDGDVTGFHGGSFDYWVVKLNTNGVIEWQKTMGGTADDLATSVTPTADGNFIVAGYSNSRNGDVAAPYNTVFSHNNCWIIKFSNSGAIIWKKNLLTSNNNGNSGNVSITQTPDKGFVISEPVNHENNVADDKGDGAVIKIDSGGNMQWSRILGGASRESINSLAIKDNDFVVAGYNSGADGDVAFNHGGQDMWVVKLKEGTAKSSQIISFDILSKKDLHDADFKIPATSSSDLSLHFTSSDTSVATITGGNKIHIKSLGTTTITASQSGNADYLAATPVNHLLTVINKTPQTINFSALPAKGVKDADFVLTATASSGLQVTYTSSDTSKAIIIRDSIVRIIAIGSTTITAAQSGNNTYSAATPVAHLLTITKATQTITFAALPAKSVADADFILNATTTSGLVIKYTSSDTAVATIAAGNKVHIKAIGITTITASQGGNNIYAAATPVAQQLTISKKTQVITFGPLSNRYIGEGHFTLGATSSSGLPVSYTSSDTTIAKITQGNIVLMLHVGVTTITALQAGDANYKAATPVAQKLTIFKDYQYVTFPTLYRYASWGDFTLNANSSAGLPVTYTLSDTGAATLINGNVIHVKTPGNFNITATQAGNDSYYPYNTVQGVSLLGSHQTINFPTPSGGFYNYQLCNGQAVLTATITSGLPITYTSSDTTVVSITGNTMYFKKAGLVYVTAHQDGNLYYYPSSVERKVAVTGTDTTHAIPAISIFYAPKLTTLCAGSKQVLTFTASIKNGGSEPHYRWYKNNQPLTATAPTYIDSFYKAGTDSIFCVLTTSARCVVNNDVKSNILGITVHSIPTDTPAIKVISYIPNACLNRAVIFQASIKSGGPAPFYQWKKNGVNVGKDSSFYVDSLLLDKDTVWCELTASQYCAATSHVVSNKVVQGTIYTKPIPLSVIVGLSNVTAGQKRVGYSVGRINDVIYEWAVPAGATIIAGQGTNQIVVNWGNTGGNVTVRASNPCGFTDKSILTVTVAPAFGMVNNSTDEANSLKAGTRVQLYPNPAVNIAYVDFTAPEAGKYFIQVTDAQGRVLQTKETNAVKGTNKVTLNLAGYAQGIYFIRLAGSNRQQSLRLLIQR